jgi:hypothetical protein
MPERHVIEYEITDEHASAAAEAVAESMTVPAAAGKLRSLVLQSILYSVLAAAAIAFGIWRNQPWWFFVPAVLMLGVAVLLLAIGGLLAATGPWHQKQLDVALREAFRRLESPHIRWTLTDELLTVESAGKTREFRWADVKDLFLTGTFWIMKIQNAPNMLLLADRIPDATARFLLLRARDAGATIRVAGGKVFPPEPGDPPPDLGSPPADGPRY